MSTHFDQIKILNLIFGSPRTKIPDSQFNDLRMDLPGLQRQALREYFCHQKTIEQISTDLETSTQEVQRYIAFGLTRLRQYQRRLLAGMDNVIFFRSPRANSPCHRCKMQLKGCSPERYCSYCSWDELEDPTKCPIEQAARSEEEQENV